MHKNKKIFLSTSIVERILGVGLFMACQTSGKMALDKTVFIYFEAE